MKVAFVMVAAIVVSGCGAAGPSPSATPVKPSQPPRTELSAAPSVDSPDLDGMLTELAPGPSTGALALVQRGDDIWRGASGQANGKRAADPGDRFGIASTTKTFTATVVMQLVGEERLSLDDSVERWVPGLVREGDRILIRHLLNHTSGIAGYGPLGDPDSQQPLLAEPGTNHVYSNKNYEILGLIVEAATGDSLAAVVRDRIFRPLRLEDSSYGSASLGGGATDPLPWLGTPMDTTGDSVSGAGGIVSTAADLATFFRALLAGDLLDEDLRSQMLQTVDSGTELPAGFGLFGFDLACGPAWGNGGDMPTYSNQVLASPDGSNVVVVAQNTGGWPAASATAREMYCAAPSAR